MSKITKIITFSLAFILLVLTACHKDAENTTIETDVQQFDAVWNELNDTYVFWGIDTTDWDAVYTKYHPIFEGMENEPYSVWSATWTELTSTLLDHHLTIKLNRLSDNSSLWLRPGYHEVMKRDYYHLGLGLDKRKNMMNRLVSSGKLLDTVSCYYNWKDQNEKNHSAFFGSGILEQKIAYIYISSFSGLLLDTIEAFSHFKHLVAHENIKAAIIDVRDNDGGAADNLVPLLSCFTTEPVLIGYTRTKLGLGKYDLSPKTSAIVNPISGQKREIPLIMLTNINSASMGEVAPIALMHLPQCYVVGERTFGATGPAIDYLVTKEGKGYVITTAEWLFEDVDGSIYEGYGVEPDIKCLFEESLWNSGTDNQLEMAISVALDKIAENGNK